MRRVLADSTFLRVYLLLALALLLTFGLGLLGVALVDQVVNTLSDRGHEIAGITSVRLLSSNTTNGILPGPRARPEAAR